MKALTLRQRLALAFAALLLACFGATAALQMAHSTRLAQQIEQELLRRLAMHLSADLVALGLAVVQQMLQLHGSCVALREETGWSMAAASKARAQAALARIRSKVSAPASGA